jgi:hypothetical protein
MDPPEVEALQYLASHTKIPVPKIYAVHSEDGFIYIEVEYIPGNTLQAAWKGLSRDQKDGIFADPKQHISCLRELPPPSKISCPPLFKTSPATAVSEPGSLAR